MEPTTREHVEAAEAAVLLADEHVEATAVLLADAVVEGQETDMFVKMYKSAKAHRVLAWQVAECTRRDARMVPA